MNAQLLFVVSFLQYMCWERGYDKDKLRKVIGSWKNIMEGDTSDGAP